MFAKWTTCSIIKAVPFQFFKGRVFLYFSMAQLKLKLGIALGAGSAIALKIASAFADTFDATNTKALITDAIADWGDVAIVALGAVLAVFALLLAGGFGISRLRKYVHGKKV